MFNDHQKAMWQMCHDYEKQLEIYGALQYKTTFRIFS